MSTNEQEIETFRALKEGKVFPHPNLCICEDCLTLRNEEARGAQADDPPGCRCSGCLYRGEKFAYYEDLQSRFKSAVMRAEDRICGTGFNNIAAELNELLANPPRVDECMVKVIISGVKEGLHEISRRGER